MFSKVSVKIIIISCLVSLGGCSTTKPTNVACDFVVGAGDNAIERHENKNKSGTHGNKVKNNQNSDTLEGILNIFGGMLTRSLNNDSSKKCT
ncbi:hypothetical protein H4J46_16245 [Colwellia sp. MB02u-6]|jgi:hypothetical protein|uniref:hypothetical protein n=1 Tax=unclassified Colwellia TaxID=196834 RepID=UPI0015F3A253|nr:MULTISPECIES: hypothetical protein [unclassified Colwellia]MBA6296385.1 hypothetical protein [Colwellia sp. MB02u-9]MBA6329465.1 hypothetical protein [Colwellia sp. MB02u-6]